MSQKLSDVCILDWVHMAYRTLGWDLSSSDFFCRTDHFIIFQFDPLSYFVDLRGWQCVESVKSEQNTLGHRFIKKDFNGRYARST